MKQHVNLLSPSFGGKLGQVSTKNNATNINSLVPYIEDDKGVVVMFHKRKNSHFTFHR